MAVVLGLVILAGLLLVDVGHTDTRIDTVTGSRARQTVWFSRFTRGPATDASALELRLRKMGAAWTPNWQHLHITSHNIFGQPMGRGSNTAPPILQLQGVMEFFVASSTDEELLQFVRTMNRWRSRVC